MLHIFWCHLPFGFIVFVEHDQEWHTLELRVICSPEELFNLDDASLVTDINTEEHTINRVKIVLPEPSGLFASANIPQSQVIMLVVYLLDIETDCRNSLLIELVVFELE